MGFEARPATPTELDAMCVLLRESIQEGGVGISTGLIYPPCVYGEWNELVALATTTAKAGGFWVVHIRNEGDRCEFDPERIIDRATYEEPTRDPEGIRYVLVNGQIALEDGVETGVLAGRVCGKTWHD